MKKIGLFVFLTLIYAFSAVAIKNYPYFIYTPAISPDGKKIVFSYNKDLWIVDANGGSAYRLTGMDGTENNPRFSPDNKWIAFSGNQDGNSNIYIMPVKGGEIKQLTFYDSKDTVDSWSWDSEYIFFNSDRYNNFSEYKVSIKGGTPIRLYKNFFNTIHGVVEHPITGSHYFTDTWESLIFASRKRYKGDYNPDIKSYNIKTKKFILHTKYRGKDFSPTIDKDGNIYFLSDRYNNEYNLFLLKNNKTIRLTSFESSIKNPIVSANGKRIVFTKDYALFIYDTKVKKSKRVKIKLFRNNPLRLENSFNVKGKITFFDISNDGKKIVFVSRGELFVSDIKGKFVNLIKTNNKERILEAIWLKDNKTILYNQTTKGWLNLFKIRVNRKNSIKQLTFDSKNNRNIMLNYAKSKALYLSGATELKIINLETFESDTVLKDEFWGYYNSQPFFSPDDSYIVFTAYRNFEQDILIYNIKTKKIFNLTNTGVTETSPFWSPDGKYLYFSSDRFHPEYPRGASKSKIFRMPLQKFSKPFKSKEFNKLFISTVKKKDKKKKELKNKQPNVKINLKDISKRWELVSPSQGNQHSPFVIIEKDTIYTLYTSNHDGKTNNLWVTVYKPFEKPKTKKIKGAVTYTTNIIAVKKKYYALIKGNINILNIKNFSLKPIKMSYHFKHNLQNEFNQMFYELWSGIKENFYDENFHNTNWNEIKDKYSKFLPYINSRSDLKILITDMLGELNSSHQGFYSFGSEEKTYYNMKTMSTGLVFYNKKPYTVKSIIKNSPADKINIDIKKNDRIISINGVKINKNLNREYYFRTPSICEDLKLTLKRGDKIINTILHPYSSHRFKNNIYDKWIDKNQQIVDEKGKKRIAYIHMRNMSTDQLNNFLIEMTSETYNRDALILDLRYNTGGNVHDAVLNFLSQRPYSYWKYRGGKYSNQPNFIPASKPIVLLINEQTLSDGEMTASGFKTLKLGKIIGTETYRWIIFTSGKSLVDGSFYRLPSWGCFTLDKNDLELNGVKPDIYIKNTFKDKLSGKDPQLEAAINIIKKQLK